MLDFLLDYLDIFGYSKYVKTEAFMAIMEVAMLQRRVIITGLCAAFGVPKR